ncbi:hypothetical protein T12_9922, partial [Trichinella patagoniensis]
LGKYLLGRVIYACVWIQLSDIIIEWQTRKAERQSRFFCGEFSHYNIA